MWWLWGLWAGVSALLLGGATAMEISMVKKRINGANGLFFYVSLVFVAMGSVVVVILTWILRDLRSAAFVAAVAAVSVWVVIQLIKSLAARAMARRR